MPSYEPLETFLAATPSHIKEVTLSFAQLELILGDVLPPSHLNHRQWWENQTDTLSRPQAQAWINAGFKVDKVNQNVNGWVNFIRL